MNDGLKGVITNIQRFSVHDGPGIRTTVFMKGCPLRCMWCHNPETHLPYAQPQLNSLKCTGCGACAAVCENNCHMIEVDEQRNSFRHLFDTSDCMYCNKCVGVCRYGALEICGYQVSVDEVISEVLKDKAFYGKKGGITLSGGEPMIQADFVNSVLRVSKDNNLTTCVETCGIGADKLDTANCDYIYYDIKTLDNDAHKKITGISNEKIIKNLKHLAKGNESKIFVRTVIVKGITDSEKHIKDITMLLKSIGVTHLELLAFHPYGSSKADAIGLKREFMGAEYIPDNEKTAKLKESIDL